MAEELNQEEKPTDQFHRTRMISLKWYVQYFKLEKGKLIQQAHMTDGPYTSEREAKLHILEDWSDADKSDLAVGAI